MIKGFCFTSDERYHRMGEWCKNSFEATNPYEMILVDLEQYKDSRFYKWHHATKEHPLRVQNPFGMLKFIAALEIMETQDLDKLIMLGADVFTVGSFDGIENMDYELLHSRDLGSAPGMPLNPDVIVVTKSFLNKAVEIYLQQMETVTLDPNIYTYQEMYIMNHLVNVGEVTNSSLAHLFGVPEYCFNMNVRTNVSFSYNITLDLVTYGDSVVRTIHIQTGLGGDKAAVDAKLFGCLNSYPAFSDQGVRTFIQKITKDNIWN
jgi:hypothetical protein